MKDPAAILTLHERAIANAAKHKADALRGHSGDIQTAEAWLAAFWDGLVAFLVRGVQLGCEFVYRYHSRVAGGRREATRCRTGSAQSIRSKSASKCGFMDIVHSIARELFLLHSRRPAYSSDSLQTIGLL